MAKCGDFQAAEEPYRVGLGYDQADVSLAQAAGMGDPGSEGDLARNVKDSASNPKDINWERFPSTSDVRPLPHRVFLLSACSCEAFFSTVFSD